MQNLKKHLSNRLSLLTSRGKSPSLTYLALALSAATFSLNAHSAQLYSIPSTTSESQLEMSAIFEPSFENCGVYLTLPNSIDIDEVHIEYRQKGSANYQLAHPFTQYDLSHAATSLFSLSPNTEYDVRITAISGNSRYYDEYSFTTKERFTIPKPTQTIIVSNTNELNDAIDSAVGGEHIILQPGTYAPFSIRSRHFSKEAPLVIRGNYNNSRPHIQGPGSGTTPAVYLSNTSHIILDYLEMSDGGSSSAGINLYLRGSSSITVQNSVIREGGRYNVLISKTNLFSGNADEAGYHLIQNNDIYDADYQNCTGSLIEYCDNRTTFGIVSQNAGGGGHIIRNNNIYGHYDNISPCSEGGNSGVSDSVNLYAFTGGGTSRNGHDIEVYGNHLYDASDDNIELDGVCTNVRVYENDLGDTNNQFSLAPALPGPFFVHHNRAYGEFRQASIKMNTSAGDDSEPSRNIFFYNNSFVRFENGSLVNLYFDHPEHRVPIENIQIFNNLFVSPNGGRATKALNGGSSSEHPVFDYNLWYNGEPNPRFSWNGGEAYTWENFRAATGQESNGVYSDLCIKEDGYSLASNNPAENKGIIIPNINDDYSSSAPDIGAFEIR